MKKENIYKFLYVVSIILIIGFATRLGIDYYKYDSHNNSNPFYTYVLIRTVEFLIPSIVAFAVAKVISKN